MEIAKNIRRLIDEKKTNQRQVALKAGISPEYLSQILSGKIKNIGIEKIEALSKSLEVHPDEILFSPEKQLHHLARTMGKKKLEEVLSSKTEFISDFLEVPLLTGTVAAGDFEQSFGHWEGETLMIPKGIYKEKEIVAWKIKGRSMEPRYNDGDTVIVSKKFDCIDGADVIAVKNGNEATIKQLKILDDKTVELRPYNPNYATIQFDSCDEVEIIGEVIGFYREVKRRKK